MNGPSVGLKLLNELDADARGWPVIIASTPFAPICWSLPETRTEPSHTTASPPTALPVLPERNYLMTQAARLRETLTNPSEDNSR